jgi:hypothetical protein
MFFFYLALGGLGHRVFFVHINILLSDPEPVFVTGPPLGQHSAFCVFRHPCVLVVCVCACVCVCVYTVTNAL